MKIETNIDNKFLRNFGLITAAIISILFGLLLPIIFDHKMAYWPWVIASILCSLALLAPSMLGPVYRVWMKVGFILGWINTRIILGIMFYLVFLPFGLVMRVFSKDPLNRKLDENSSSYRVIHLKRSKSHIERPF